MCTYIYIYIYTHLYTYLHTYIHTQRYARTYCARGHAGRRPAGPLPGRRAAVAAGLNTNNNKVNAYTQTNNRHTINKTPA